MDYPLFLLGVGVNVATNTQPKQFECLNYPTGQKYSLELIFAKFATAKIAKDLNLLKISSASASCLKTTLKYSHILLNGCPDPGSNLRSLDFRSDALPTEQHRRLVILPKSLRLVPNH